MESYEVCYISSENNVHKPSEIWTNNNVHFFAVCNNKYSQTNMFRDSS